MRIAVISDIHGNAVALEAALEDIRQADVTQIVCLGDAIQGGPQPAEVVAYLRAAQIPVVMGNADAWLLTGIVTEAEAIDPERERVMEIVRAWSLSRLAPEDQAFIAAFQPTITIALTAQQHLLCFHGSPTSFDDVIVPSTPDDLALTLLGEPEANFLTGGHTHLQQLRRLGARLFFNPGSVGLAYSHQQTIEQFRADPWAEYAILSVDSERIALEFRRIPFDVTALAHAYHTSGHPNAHQALAQYGL